MSALEQHFSAKEIAERLGISESKVRSAMYRKPGSRGYLHSVLVGLDSRRVPASSLQAWLNDAPQSRSVGSVHSLDERRK